MQTETGTPLSTKTHPHSLRSRLLAVLAGVGIVGYTSDQVTKAWASAGLVPGVRRSLVGGLLQLNLTRNAGAAFSVATSATWVLTIIAIVVICVTIYAARRLGSKGWAVALGLLLAGALGNLTDRFFRSPGGGQGHVVDFLELPHWPIFNVADMCVVSAAVLIGLLAVRGIGVDGARATTGSESHDDRNQQDADGKSNG